MQKLKLNNDMGKLVQAHDFELDPTQEYVIDVRAELESQSAIHMAIQTMGLSALRDYWNWLETNGFNVEMPNPTNAVVSQYFGKKPLWKTNLSQGIVVKSENDDDYYIIIECSRLNEGFKYAQIIATLGGCL